MEEELLTLRQRLIEDPDRANIIWQAVSNYNSRLSRLAEEVSSEINKTDALQKKGTELMHRLEKHPDPNDQADLRLIQGILSAKQSGLTIEELLTEIKVTKVVHNYQEKIEEMQKRGLIVHVNNYSEAGQHIRDLHDFQIALFGREFEIPRPFSQNLIKRVILPTDKAYWMALDYLVNLVAQKELKGHFDQSTPGYINLRRRKSIRSAAENLVSDLPRFAPVRLISKKTLDKVVETLHRQRPRNRTIKKIMQEKSNYFSQAVFSELSIIPDVCYTAAYSELDPNKPYLTVISQGFDRHKKIFLFQNNLAGLRMLLYAGVLEKKLTEADLKDVNPKILKDIARITKQQFSEQYGWSVEGNIFSVSGDRDFYDVDATHIAVFPKSQLRKTFAYWPDLTTSCVCKDAKYIRKMHQNWRHTPSYVDKHNAYFVIHCILGGIERGDVYQNPLGLPKPDKLEFEEKLRNQVLVIKKANGQPKVLNRAEREVISNADTVARGFKNCYSTVNVDRVVNNARKFYSLG